MSLIVTSAAYRVCGTIAVTGETSLFCLPPEGSPVLVSD